MLDASAYGANLPQKQLRFSDSTLEPESIKFFPNQCLDTDLSLDPLAVATGALLVLWRPS